MSFIFKGLQSYCLVIKIHEQVLPPSMGIHSYMGSCPTLVALTSEELVEDEPSSAIPRLPVANKLRYHTMSMK